MHKILVNRLIKLAHEKGVVRRIDRPDWTIVVDRDVKQQTKPKRHTTVGDNWSDFIPGQT